MDGFEMYSKNTKGVEKMVIKQITDEAFKAYGRVVEGIDFTELLEAMRETPLPENVVYEPGVELLEKLAVKEQLERIVYGELPIQIGYCNGNNYKLNAVEYHRSSEVNVAATDLVLLLGKQQDITKDFTYDTGLIEAFFVPQGTAVELYATTLHYAPCNANESGFKDVIVLPKGTNLALDGEHGTGEDALITAKNKWLIGHAEGGLDAGAHIGLVGKNINILD